MVEKGHEDQFAARQLNACCWFRQGTFAICVATGVFAPPTQAIRRGSDFTSKPLADHYSRGDWVLVVGWARCADSVDFAALAASSRVQRPSF
jgi:hypothetical protein